MDEQAAQLSDWSKERTSGGLAQAVVHKLKKLRQADRDVAADFVKRNFSWERTFSRQMQVYADGR
jgi:hypothetical protein